MDSCPGKPCKHVFKNILGLCPLRLYSRTLSFTCPWKRKSLVFVCLFVLLLFSDWSAFASSDIYWSFKGSPFPWSIWDPATSLFSFIEILLACFDGLSLTTCILGFRWISSHLVSMKMLVLGV